RPPCPGDGGPGAAGPAAPGNCGTAPEAGPGRDGRRRGPRPAVDPGLLRRRSSAQVPLYMVTDGRRIGPEKSSGGNPDLQDCAASSAPTTSPRVGVEQVTDPSQLPGTAQHPIGQESSPGRLRLQRQAADDLDGVRSTLARQHPADELDLQPQP